MALKPVPVLVALVAVLALGWCAVALTDAEAPRTLQATVWVGPTELRVANGDDGAWVDCDVSVNRRWRREVPRIEAGDTFALGWTSFTQNDGERFTPRSHAVERVTVHCSTPTGRGSWFGAY
ncbi:MAG: hypothetical protein AMXMBFR53_36540 [Gemmatimonadota bacterium]